MPLSRESVSQALKDCNRPIVLKSRPGLVTHALSGESAFFARRYVKSES